MIDGKKVMFEIFRERRDGDYRVVYYTELGEHEKDYALSEAMNGETVFSGFLLYREREHAKAKIAELLGRMNSGGDVSSGEIERELSGFTAA
jgi:hypothetical protein